MKICRLNKCFHAVCCVLILCNIPVMGQQIRLDNLKEQYSKKNLFHINGGLAANGVFYTGDNSGRQPFMWGISGNVNISLFY